MTAPWHVATTPTTRPSRRRAGAGANAVQDAAWRRCVAHCADRDQRAFAVLYDQSCRLVYSLILRIVRNAADAEEVTLDVYTQVWNNAQDFDGSRGTVSAWLVMLARSRAIDRLRSRRTYQQHEAPGAEVFDCASSALSPEGQAEETERRRRVIAALQSLSADQREVLMLAFFQGLTHSELAERLDQPLGTVKTRIRTGMIKLREQLAPLARVTPDPPGRRQPALASTQPLPPTQSTTGVAT